jgi:hypothetical protein
MFVSEHDQVSEKRETAIRTHPITVFLILSQLALRGEKFPERHIPFSLH